MKVFHAARQDVEIFNNLGVIPKPLFDTQIAAHGRRASASRSPMTPWCARC